MILHTSVFFVFLLLFLFQSLVWSAWPETAGARTCHTSIGFGLHHASLQIGNTCKPVYARQVTQKGYPGVEDTLTGDFSIQTEGFSNSVLHGCAFSHEGSRWVQAGTSEIGTSDEGDNLNFFLTNFEHNWPEDAEKCPDRIVNNQFSYQKEHGGKVCIPQDDPDVHKFNKNKKFASPADFLCNEPIEWNTSEVCVRAVLNELIPEFINYRWWNFFGKTLFNLGTGSNYRRLICNNAARRLPNGTSDVPEGNSKRDEILKGTLTKKKLRHFFQRKSSLCWHLVAEAKDLICEAKSRSVYSHRYPYQKLCKHTTESWNDLDIESKLNDLRAVAMKAPDFFNESGRRQIGAAAGQCVADWKKVLGRGRCEPIFSDGKGNIYREVQKRGRKNLGLIFEKRHIEDCMKRVRIDPFATPNDSKASCEAYSVNASKKGRYCRWTNLVEGEEFLPPQELKKGKVLIGKSTIVGEAWRAANEGCSQYHRTDIAEKHWTKCGKNVLGGTEDLRHCRWIPLGDDDEIEETEEDISETQSIDPSSIKVVKNEPIYGTPDYKEKKETLKRVQKRWRTLSPTGDPEDLKRKTRWKNLNEKYKDKPQGDLFEVLSFRVVKRIDVGNGIFIQDKDPTFHEKYGTVNQFENESGTFANRIGMKMEPHGTGIKSQRLMRGDIVEAVEEVYSYRGDVMDEKLKKQTAAIEKKDRIAIAKAKNELDKEGVDIDDDEEVVDEEGKDTMYIRLRDGRLVASTTFVKSLPKITDNDEVNMILPSEIPVLRRLDPQPGKAKSLGFYKTLRKIEYRTFIYPEENIPMTDATLPTAIRVGDDYASEIFSPSILQFGERKSIEKGVIVEAIETKVAVANPWAACMPSEKIKREILHIRDRKSGMWLPIEEYKNPQYSPPPIFLKKMDKETGTMIVKLSNESPYQYTLLESLEKVDAPKPPREQRDRSLRRQRRRKNLATLDPLKPSPPIPEFPGSPRNAE
eukprot:g6166.t1